MIDQPSVGIFLRDSEESPVERRISDCSAKVSGNVDVGIIGHVLAGLEDTDANSGIF
jgi:hypothetical protein